MLCRVVAEALHSGAPGVFDARADSAVGEWRSRPSCVKHSDSADSAWWLVRYACPVFASVSQHVLRVFYAVFFFPVEHFLHIVGHILLVASAAAAAAALGVRVHSPAPRRQPMASVFVCAALRQRAQRSSASACARVRV
jgi:hypothetical protein